MLGLQRSRWSPEAKIGVEHQHCWIALAILMPWSSLLNSRPRPTMSELVGSRQGASPGVYIHARAGAGYRRRMADASAIEERYAAVRRSLNERGRRLFAAAEARTAGRGGISASARATGVARSTIGRGLKDLDDPDALSGVSSTAGQRPACADRRMIPRCLKTCAGYWNRRRWVTDVTAVVGVEEPRKTGGGAVCDGTPDWQEQHSQTARPLEIPPTGKSQDP